MQRNSTRSYLLEILLELLRRKKVTVNELAQKLEFSTRTILRYIDAIAEAGVPVVTQKGRGGGVYISESYKLESMFFTKEEMNVIRTALDLMEKNSIGDETCSEVIEKLESIEPKTPEKVLTTNRIRIDGGAWGDLKLYRDKAQVIENALDGHDVLKITYRDRSLKETVRKIEPSCFVLKEGVWYIAAYCRLRKDFRLFKLSRIVSMVTEKEKYEEKELPENAYRLDFPEDVKTVDIVLKVTENARYGVEEWLGAEAVKKTSKGNVIASATVQDNGELIGKLLSFGGEIEVQSPSELKDKLRATAQAALGVLKKD